jgi:RecG-like helicase
VPFDVEKILSGRPIYQHEFHEDIHTIQENAKPQVRRLEDVPISPVEDSHYAENVQPIAAATWRHRAHVRGNVSSIRSAPTNSTPRVDVEIWDETGGITLQFIGRREISGLEIGTNVCAEGMVGEVDGNLVILNPSYEIILN